METNVNYKQNMARFRRSCCTKRRATDRFVELKLNFFFDFFKVYDNLRGFQRFKIVFCRNLILSNMQIKYPMLKYKAKTNQKLSF